MEPTLATVLLFAGNFQPLGWAYCDGRLMSIAQNTALFSLVGTTYGGDGQVTFALPDLRGRTAIGAGQAPGRSVYDLGQMAGHEQVTLIQSQLPQHTHTLNVPTTDAGGSSDDPNGNILALQNTNVYAAPSAAGGSYGGAAAGPAGGNQPMPTLVPYLAQVSLMKWLRVCLQH